MVKSVRAVADRWLERLAPSVESHAACKTCPPGSAGCQWKCCVVGARADWYKCCWASLGCNCTGAGQC